MGAVRVTLAAAVRRFGGKKAVCVAESPRLGSGVG